MAKVEEELISALSYGAAQINEITSEARKHHQPSQWDPWAQLRLVGQVQLFGQTLQVEADSLQAGTHLTEVCAQRLFRLIDGARLAAAACDLAIVRDMVAEALRPVQEVLDRHAQLVNGLLLFREEAIEKRSRQSELLVEFTSA